MASEEHFRPARKHHHYQRTFAVRVPPALQRQLEAVALRDSVNISSTIRRLLSVGLRADEREEDQRAAAR